MKKRVKISSHVRYKSFFKTCQPILGRHTILKRKGISSEFIKESLGHSSLVTTENYLDSFTDDVKLEYANLLTDLKA